MSITQILAQYICYQIYVFFPENRSLLSALFWVIG